MEQFLAYSLRLDGAVFDKYCDAFGVDIDEPDMYDALDACEGNYKYFGGFILERMWQHVIEKYEELLDADKFYCDCSSTSHPDFYYDNEIVCSKDDLDAIAERNNKS